MGSVEAETPAIDGIHGEMVVGTVPPLRTLTEQVVPGTMSSNDSRGLMTQPAGHDQSALHQCVSRRRLLFGPPSS